MILLPPSRFDHPAPRQLIILPPILPRLLPALHLRLDGEHLTLHRGRRLLLAAPAHLLRLDLMPPDRAILAVLTPRPFFLLLPRLKPRDVETVQRFKAETPPAP